MQLQLQKNTIWLDLDFAIQNNPVTPNKKAA